MDHQGERGEGEGKGTERAGGEKRGDDIDRNQE